MRFKKCLLQKQFTQTLRGYDTKSLSPAPRGKLRSWDPVGVLPANVYVCVYSRACLTPNLWMSQTFLCCSLNLCPAPTRGTSSIRNPQGSHQAAPGPRVVSVHKFTF